MEEQGAARGTEGQVSELIEDDEIGVSEPAGDLSSFALGLFLFESVDELDCGEEADALVMVLDGLDAESRSDMGLAGAGRTSAILPGVRCLKPGSRIGFIRAQVISSR